MSSSRGKGLINHSNTIWCEQAVVVVVTLCSACLGQDISLLSGSLRSTQFAMTVIILTCNCWLCSTAVEKSQNARFIVFCGCQMSHQKFMWRRKVRWLGWSVDETKILNYVAGKIIGLQHFMGFGLCAVWHRLDKTGVHQHRDRQRRSVTSPALLADMLRVHSSVQPPVLRVSKTIYGMWLKKKIIYL